MSSIRLAPLLTMSHRRRALFVKWAESRPIENPGDCELTEIEERQLTVMLLDIANACKETLRSNARE